MSYPHVFQYFWSCDRKIINKYIFSTLLWPINLQIEIQVGRKWLSLQQLTFKSWNTGRESYQGIYLMICKFTNRFNQKYGLSYPVVNVWIMTSCFKLTCTGHTGNTQKSHFTLKICQITYYVRVRQNQFEMV